MSGLPRSDSATSLADYFEFIWGIDNAARSKAESLAQAAAELGLAPDQIVYVGDTEKDARCAQACGMNFVGADWGGFEDMGKLASAAGSAGLMPLVALQSPATVREGFRLIRSGATLPVTKQPCSSRTAEQGGAKLIIKRLSATSKTQTSTARHLTMLPVAGHSSGFHG